MVLWDAGMCLLDARQLFAQDIVNLWDKSPMVEIVQVEIVQVEISRHFIARNGAEQVQETIENALDLIGLHGFGKYAVLSYILGTQSQELAGFSNPYDAKEPYNKLVQRIMVHERPAVFCADIWDQASRCPPLVYLSRHRIAMDQDELNAHFKAAVQAGKEQVERASLLLMLCANYIDKNEIGRLHTACMSANLGQYSVHIHTHLLEHLNPLNALAYWIAWRQMDKTFRDDILLILDCMPPAHFAMALRDRLTMHLLLYVLLDTAPQKLARSWASINRWCEQGKCSLAPAQLHGPEVYAMPWIVGYQLHPEHTNAFVQFQTLLDNMRVQAPSDDALALLQQHLATEMSVAWELPLGLV